ncbi:MAG: sulfurtransferase [Rubrivivax sp.]|nr:sulfurtransferase [Rubrivivax sp.]
MTTRRFLLSATVAAAALLPAALLAQTAAPPPNYPPQVGQMVAAVKKQVKTINLQQFKEAFDRKALGTVIDVRNENEFADGFIPGAINVPRGLIEFRIWKELGFPGAVDMNRQLTLYCATGGRCALATKSLMDLGFTNVTSADMKFDDWAKAGYPVSKPRP